MNLTELKIDGFGVWRGLEIHGLSSGLNVFYGPNEAGKTTLMQFARAVLYGFSPERRARYLPSVRGGRGGGSLGASTRAGSFRISRVDRDGVPLGDATVLAPDGTIQGESQLSSLLGDVDESIFNNVFAVGLSELQELGTLDATAAARLLYDLSTGLDRVSLGEVLRELDASRIRLLGPDGKPSQIGELRARCDALRAELDELSTLTTRHWRLAEDRDRLTEAIVRAEADVAAAERESRLVELAAALSPKWQARAALDEQLAALGPPSHLPPNAVARMERFGERIRIGRRRHKRIAGKLKQRRAELAGLKINEPLWKQSPRILALAEHESWIAAAEQQLRDAEAALAKLEPQTTPARSASEGSPAGAAALSARLPPGISHQTLAALRAPAADLRRKSRAAREAKQAIGQAQQQAADHHETVEKALADAGHSDLPAALEKAGNLTAQLRRRVQLDERLDRMTRHRADLEEQSHELLERQILPGWILASLGGVFMLGVLLLLAGLFLPTKIIGSFGWTLAVLGVLAFGTAAAAKWLLEKAAARQLDSCRKQLTLLETQTKQAQQERDTLDEQLPKGGGSLTSRLQAAEAELAKLEALMPLDAKRAAAGQDAQSAEQRAASTRDELKAAHRRWQAALVAAGLPKTLAPKQIGQLVRQSKEHGDAQRNLRDARDERDRRQRELAAFTARIEPLFIDAELLPDSTSPSEQLRHLRRQVAEQETLVGRRDILRRRLRRLRAQKKKQRRMLDLLKRRRAALLRRAGVTDEAEFARRAAEHSQVDQLHRRRAALDREVKDGCTGVCSESDLASLLAGTAQQLAERRTNSADKVQAARAALNRLFEERGQLNEQLRVLGDDHGIGRKRLQLGVVEQRLKEAVEQWQVLATTRMILESIKHDYERNRQPETLREASGYLARLTGGRYIRVWTPLGEETLRVDDATGHALSIEVLSRGTREQLFLSLRMALVGLYARRGATMPFVLDDVLVNFDAERARAAAAVLRDFAAAGHQLLVFTCHEHLASLFESLDVHVRRLPSNADLSETPAPQPPREIVIEQPRRRRARPKPEPVAAPVEPPPVAVPIAAAIVREEPARVEPVVLKALIEPLESPDAPAAVRPQRADPPHQRIIMRRFRRRWSAEEFEGELEDRVAGIFAADDRSRGDDRLTDGDLAVDTSDI
jgi:uncharacterized protein YhaN